uniref:HTH OST-type domain-containing protein n=1 Tax=Chromera velia CCMP2878 TaxID=1169474 RepID=A0A0G4IDH0_9ALVE|eukprot:Cvel_13420.t1-p1 / transcript=Cvel_13420.t1 / gene=Cvel_13420 / organism=Chromera_velia_CCMP2878 / gene_product=hypothetical protein / transcript_product=hypothetical protein / location=Cvel_scaffold915:42624-46797(-) / protein_length=1003 / sequence_SO=supercontig / SO=protein_coding / is_pseudo=false
MRNPRGFHEGHGHGRSHGGSHGHGGHGHNHSSSSSSSSSAPKGCSCSHEHHELVLERLVVGLYLQQIKPLAYEVRRRLQKTEDACPWLQHEFVYVCQASKDRFTLEYDDPEGPTLLLKKTPEGFLGFIEPRDPHNPFTPEQFAALCRYLLELARKGPNECAFAGGRFMMAQALQESGPAELRDMTLGQLCHLIQLAVTMGLLGYENCCLKPMVACFGLCRAVWLKMTGGEGGQTCLDVQLEGVKQKMARLLVAHPEGLCMSQLRHTWQSHFGEPLPFQKFGYTKLIGFVTEKLSDVCVVCNRGKFRCHVRALRPGETPAPPSGPLQHQKAEGGPGIQSFSGSGSTSGEAQMFSPSAEPLDAPPSASSEMTPLSLTDAPPLSADHKAAVLRALRSIDEGLLVSFQHWRTLAIEKERQQQQQQQQEAAEGETEEAVFTLQSQEEEATRTSLPAPETSSSSSSTGWQDNQEHTQTTAVHPLGVSDIDRQQPGGLLPIPAPPPVASSRPSPSPVGRVSRGPGSASACSPVPPLPPAPAASPAAYKAAAGGKEAAGQPAGATSQNTHVPSLLSAQENASTAGSLLCAWTPTPTLNPPSTARSGPSASPLQHQRTIGADDDECVEGGNRSSERGNDGGAGGDLESPPPLPLPLPLLKPLTSPPQLSDDAFPPLSCARGKGTAAVGPSPHWGLSQPDGSNGVIDDPLGGGDWQCNLTEGWSEVTPQRAHEEEPEHQHRHMPWVSAVASSPSPASEDFDAHGARATGAQLSEYSGGDSWRALKRASMRPAAVAAAGAAAGGRRDGPPTMQQPPPPPGPPPSLPTMPSLQHFHHMQQRGPFLAPSTQHPSPAPEGFPLPSLSHLPPHSNSSRHAGRGSRSSPRGSLAGSSGRSDRSGNGQAVDQHMHPHTLPTQQQTYKREMSSTSIVTQIPIMPPQQSPTGSHGVVSSSSHYQPSFQSMGGEIMPVGGDRDSRVFGDRDRESSGGGGSVRATTPAPILNWLERDGAAGIMH